MKNIKFYFTIYIVLTLLFISNVSAATFSCDTSASNRLYLTGSSSSYTFYNKKIDGNVAYCMKLNTQIPHGSESKEYTRVTTSSWLATGADAVMAAQIIKVGREYPGNIYDTNRYLWIQEALNCKFRLNGSYTSNNVCSDGMVSDIIATAESLYNQLKFNPGSNTAPLPTTSFSSTNRQMDEKNANNGTYMSKKINLTGLVSSYGGSGYESEPVNYKMTLSSTTGNAYVCTNDNINSCSSTAGTYTIPSGTSGTFSFYVLLRNGGTDGGKVTINLTGANKSKYPTAYYWESVISSRQSMVTYSKDGATISRSTSSSYSILYNAVPEETPKYSAGIEKVDPNGNLLTGSNLVLFTAGNSSGTASRKTVCSITDGKTSCNKNNLENDANSVEGYSEGRYLCYEETKTPSGYIKNSGVICSSQPITLTSSDTVYIKNDDGGNISAGEITEEQYNYFTNNTHYCKYKENNIDTDYINTVINAGLTDNDNLVEGSCTDNMHFDFKSEICINSNGEYDPDDNSCKGDDSENSTSTKYCVGSNVDFKKASKFCDEVDYPIKKSYCVYVTSSGDTEIDEDYCENGVNGGHAFTKFTPSDGSYLVSVVNSMNNIKISKTDIVGSDEKPGATLALYTTNNGTCTSTLATSLGFEYAPYIVDAPIFLAGDDNNSSTGNNDSVGDNSSSGSSNVVDYGEEAALADDISEDPKTGLKWVSGNSPAIISGLKPGTYCLKEEYAPKGYKLATSTTKFSIDEEGKIKLIDDGNGTSKYDSDSNTLSIQDDLIKLSISKQDMATGKELPGASLSICQAVKNGDGDYEMVTDYNGKCTPVTLADGSEASWVSEDTPHEIEGLGAGTYYLVEIIAPEKYQEAESILFTVDKDGNVFDKDGTSIKDSKIVMKDKPEENVKTGDVFLAVITILGILAIGYAVYYMNQTQNEL